MRCLKNVARCVAVTVMLLAAATSATLRRADDAQAFPNATNYTVPPPETSTTAPTAPPATNPYGLTLRCKLEGMGPTNHGFFIDNERGVPAPGYGHRAFNRSEDAFFIVAHDPLGTLQNARVAAILPGRNCSVAWIFNADAPITQAPMVDGESVVFQSWDEWTQTAVAYAVNATTGMELWRNKFHNVSQQGTIITAVHDGRAMMATLGPARRPSDGGLLEYRIRARYVDSGEFLWEWSAVTGHETGVPAAIAPHTKLWISYNTVASRGFAGMGGSHVMSFNGEDGGILWNYYLAWNSPFGSNTTGLTSTGGTASQGRFYCPTGEHDTPAALYIVLANHDQQIFNVSTINQCDGTLIRTPTGQVGPHLASSLPIQGPPATSSYTDTVCVTSGGNPDGHSPPSVRSMACFNGSVYSSTGEPGWTVAPGQGGAGFSALPVVGFTDPNNFVLSGVLEFEFSGKLQVEIRDHVTGNLAFPAQVVSLSETDQLMAVGAPKTFESGWDVAFVGVGRARQSGAFAVYHVGN
jgi:outer membrane protein assembly factor BamB